MLKKFRNLRVRLNSAKKQPNDILNIHTAFRQWVEKLPIHCLIRYQHGERLFIRGEDGAYSQLVIRALFEVYVMSEKRGVTFINRRHEMIKNGLIGAVMGVFITLLLFFAYGVY